MSDEQKKLKPEAEATYITMDPEEFNRVCRRLNEMLSSRVEKAWNKKNARPTRKSIDSHVEASKDAFAFIHLLDLVEHMSHEIYELRNQLRDGGDGETTEEPAGWSLSGKKTLLN